MDAVKIMEMADPDDLRNEVRQLRSEVDALKQAYLDLTRLSELAVDLGDQRGGRIYTDDLVLDDENGHSGTGTLVDGNGVHGYNAGIVQFQLSSLDGKAKFARGTAIADKDGLKMPTGSPMILDDGNDMAVFGLLPGKGAYMLSALAYAIKSLTNASFENGDLSGWAAVGTIAASQEQAQDGAWSAKFLTAGSLTSSSYITSTKKAFLLDFWLYAAGLTGYPQVIVSLEIYNSSNVLIDTIGDSFYLNSVGMWQRFIVPMRTAQTPAKVKIVISAGGTDPQYVDNIRLFDVTQLMAISHDSSSDTVKMTTQEAYKDFFPAMLSSDASQLSGIIDGNGLQQTIATATTKYVGAAGMIAAEANAAMQINADCTLKRLYIRTRTTQPVSGTLVFDMMVNGAESGMRIIVPAGAAGALFSDDTTSLSVTTGDRIALRVVNNATAGSAQIAAWSVGLFK
jgi:hypothetical protein